MFENYQVSAELCDKITTLNPTFEKAYVLRGYNFMLLEDKNAAVDNFTKALKLNPNSSLAKEYLAAVKSLKTLKPAF
jgi:tetratricopeptide (TPR) repeat protein